MEKTLFEEISDDYPTLTNTEIRNVLPEWQIWMICADAAVLVVTVTGVLLIVRRCRKNRSSIQVVQVKAQV